MYRRVVADALMMNLIAEILTEQGPTTEERLLVELRARGGELAETSVETLEAALEEDDARLMTLTDGRWAWLPALLAGRVFTHRVSARKVEHDLLDLTPDLAPLAMLIEETEIYGRLTDGSPVTVVLASFDSHALAERDVPEDLSDDDGSLLLSPGQLARLGVAEGDLVGLRLTAAGLALERIPAAVAAPETLESLRKRLDAVLREREPVEVDEAIWTVCAEDPALFTEPLPPLGEILETVGLSRHGDWLAPDGFDFAEWRTDSYQRLVMSRYDLSDDEALAVIATVTMYEQVAEMFDAVLAAQDAGDDTAAASITADLAAAVESSGSSTERDADYRDALRSVATLLTEPAVADAVLTETIGSDEDGAAALGLFAEMLESLAPRTARAPLRWLRAKAFERLGRIEQAEAMYEAAEALDPDWPPTLVDLAWYAGDRGDAARGLSLLRRADAPPEHPLVQVLEHFQARPRPGLGRNEPCWCGSGMKYKKCHLRNEQLPLDERAAWLYQKAGRYLLDGAWFDLLAETAAIRFRDVDSSGPTSEALDPLICDAVLFEGEAFDEFLDTRGVLLPDDERLLAAQWRLIDRSVYELTAVRRGEGFTARDVRTGDTLEVRERSASRQLKAGQLVCGRIVPAGDTMQVFGGLEPVALHERDDLIALLDGGPGPLELVAFLSRRFAPPALVNTESEPLVMCDTTLRVDDPAAMGAALDKEYDREEGDESRWFEHVLTHGMERIRATLQLDGDQVHVHTNSETRHERVLATLRTIDPSITVVTETRQPVRDTREAAELLTRLPGDDEDSPLPDASDPAVAAELDRFIREYEQKWLDEPIPALAGHTPRAAANDPTRRQDLIRLLDTFAVPDENQPGMMNPDRLRAALDLP
jgi:tetratricopeptide (TPR) repeat protein